ncbi:ABC transporter ATP-binding protein [Tropicibacter alexandrii]|uniref:ABC transporter ATP-binding protein n=1 Tax=Tropicibacter alexandrii TaxID=2267683 RepID=UPI000EF51FB5|nr:ABC transporter ATP-binding protein [Tropicibacter alexandrii]
MSALQKLLEDFSSPEPSAPALSEGPVFNESELEGQKLEAFENGYRAGWDDAVKAQSEDKARISSAFAQHLQDLSFTYHEAYSQVMNGMTPLLNEMVSVLLPSMARATLGLHVVEQLHAMAKEIGTMDVQILVAPTNIDAIAPLIEGDFGFPIELIPDDTVAEEQADIKFGSSERQIDLGDLIASVTEAVAGFAHDNRRKLANG